MTISEEIRTSADFILSRQPHRPTIGVILGSGLGALGDEVQQSATIHFREIPGFVPSTAEGHQGDLVIGHLAGQTVAVMRGRIHAYEGYTPQQTTYPVRVLKALGCQTLIVTNAAGGLNPTFQAGDLMLIADHLNLPGMIGHNPLYGPNDLSLGPRFPDMTNAYDPALRDLARRVVAKLGFALREGVYVMLGGPSYETPAEVRFLRLIGGDAVGMSTASEVVVARHGGMRVLGVSLISNVIPMPGAEVQRCRGAEETSDPAAPPHFGSPALLGHEEVLATAAAFTPRFIALIKGIMREI